MHIPFGFSKVGDVENFEWELADPWKKTDKTPEGKFFTIIYENVRIKNQRADKKKQKCRIISEWSILARTLLEKKLGRRFANVKHT